MRLSLLFLSVLTTCCHALRGTALVELDSSYRSLSSDFATFGFDEKVGTAHLTWLDSPENRNADLSDNVTVVLIPVNLFVQLNRAPLWRVACAGNLASITLPPPPRNGSAVTVSLHAWSTGQYYLFLAQCDASLATANVSAPAIAAAPSSAPHGPIVINVEFHLVNGDSELSNTDQALPDSSKCMLALDVILALYWLGSVLRSSGACGRRPPFSALHLFISWWLFLKLAHTSTEFAYWQLAVRSGEHSRWLRYSFMAMEAVCEVFFYGLCLVLGKGWRLTRSQLATHEWRNGTCALTSMLILLLCTVVFGTAGTFFSFSLWLFLTSLFVLPRALGFATEQKQILDCFATALAGIQVPPHMVPLRADAANKRLFFARLRVIVIAYLIAVLLVIGARVAFMQHEWVWLGAVAEDVLNVAAGFALIVCLMPARVPDMPLLNSGSDGGPFLVDALCHVAVPDGDASDPFALRQFAHAFSSDPARIVREMIEIEEREQRVTDMFSNTFAVWFPPFNDDDSATLAGADVRLAIALRRKAVAVQPVGAAIV
jgi:hypothetical protein